MKKMLPILLVAAALLGYMAGYASRAAPQPILSGHFDGLSLIPTANAQENKKEVMPFGFNSPHDPPLAPDAPPITYWNIDDIHKAHTEMAEKAAKLVKEAGSGSSQSFGGGPVHVQTRSFSMFMLYRMFRDKPVLSLTKVNSVLDDAEQHGEMILGGKIANRQNLQDKDGIIPGEYRGQPVVGGQTYKVKAGDWLLIPPDTPHQPKPDPGGFSYFIMKINVGVYPWSLIR